MDFYFFAKDQLYSSNRFWDITKLLLNDELYKIPAEFTKSQQKLLFENSCTIDNLKIRFFPMQVVFLSIQNDTKIPCGPFKAEKAHINTLYF